MQIEPQTREAGDFEGRRILVTGGTKGIGEAIVERLIRGVGNVIATARSLPPGGKPDRSVKADVSTREGIDQVVKATVDRLGGLDILIHNVGGSAAPGGAHWRCPMTIGNTRSTRTCSPPSDLIALSFHRC